MTHHEFVVSCMPIAASEARRLDRLGVRCIVDDATQHGLLTLLELGPTLIVGAYALARVIIRRALISEFIRRPTASTRSDKVTVYGGYEATVNSHEDACIDRVTIARIISSQPLPKYDLRWRQRQWVKRVRAEVV